MAWVGNSRCLYCREKLPLYRILSGEEFCSTAHREAFLDDQTRLGLERLVGAREELSRMLTPGLKREQSATLKPGVLPNAPVDYSSNPRVSYPSLSASPIAEPNARQSEFDSEPPMVGFADEPIALADHWRFRAPEPLAFTVRTWLDVPFSLSLLTDEVTLSGADTGETGFAEVSEAEPAEADNEWDNLPMYGALPLRLDPKVGETVNPISGEPVDYDLENGGVKFPGFAVAPRRVIEVERQLDTCGLTRSDRSKTLARAIDDEPTGDPSGWLASAKKAEPVAFPASPGLSFSFVQRPLRDVEWMPNPDATADLASDEVPCMDLLQLELPRQLDQTRRRAIRVGDPIPLRSRMWIPIETSAAEAKMQESGLRSLPLDEAPLVHGIWVNELDLAEVEEYEALIPAMDTPMPNPGLRHCQQAPLQPELVTGARTAVAEYDPYPIPGQVAKPKADFMVRVLTPLASSQQFPIRPDRKPAPGESSSAWVARQTESGPFPPSAKPAMASALPGGSGQEPPRARPKQAPMVPLHWETSPKSSKPPARSGVVPATYANSPVQPNSRLAPMSLSERWTSQPVLAIGRDLAAPALAPVARFWRHAPQDLRLLAMLVPLLVILAFRPSIPKVSIVQSKSASEFSSVMSTQWRNVKHSIAGRAGVDLADDFRAGLDNWTSRGDATATWSYDATGFVRPGPLALYQPSMGLSDYNLELLTEINRKSLGMVVRAANFDRYQAVRLSVLKPGPIPKVAVIHYAVIGGKEGQHIEVPIPFDVRSDTLYHVRIEARGDDFTVHVQDKLVAFWSDNRFRAGGVGLFCSKGEDARVRWIEVMHQYDALGRLCAYLAPYGMQTSNGSWTQQ